MQAEIRKQSADTNWLTGQAGQYSFNAKVYDEPSNFGIRKGRVSKLEIRDAQENVVLNYDRGWDVRPTKDIKPVMDAILALFKNPKKS